MNIRPSLLTAILAGVALGLFALPVFAQGTGILKGVVKSEKGEPLAFANVVVLGTTMGSMTDSEGKYTISNLPVGQYVLKVTYLGYEAQERDFQMNAGQTVALNFKLSEAVVATMETVKVIGHQDMLRRTESSTAHRLGDEELERLPVDTLAEAINLKSGVVSQAGQLHFRGGRAGEVQFQIDGVPVNDPFGGGGVDVATVSVADAQVLLGGMDAEYGNAQSGIINVVTQEGGDTFSGQVEYMTDDFGAPDKTFNNFDRIAIGLGGPTPVRTLNYFVSLQGTWTDTYLATKENRERWQVLDFITVGPRQNNAYNFQAKLSWKPGPNYKATFEILNNTRNWDDYEHPWSAEGFTETRIDTVADTGEITTRFGEFSERQEGPNWVYFNAAEHTPDYEDKFRLYKVVWNHTLSQGTFYTLKLSQSANSFSSAVQGKFPWEYEARFPDQWRDRINFDTHPYFSTNGDVGVFTDRDTKTWTFKTDWTSQMADHKMKTGVEFRYNDLALLSVLRPNNINAEGEIGAFRSEFHYFNPEGAFYIQDRWEHEGMVLNAGLRYDVFSVGNQLDASEVENRIRSQWSPRVGIAYPVSDRDVFSFHYGRFSQIPDRRVIFEDRGGAVITRGNPNLENETTVSYQSALQHMFTEDVFGQFSVYFKDIYGLLAVDQVQSGDSPGLVNQWSNKDYASARGFELSLTKRFTQSFAGEFSYTYGIATGVASDPNVTQVVDFLYLPISEQPLNWDQRHTIAANATVAQPAGNWSVNMVWIYGTGFPYTPRDRNERQADPLKTNSRRLPSTSSLTIQAEKHYRIWGQRVKFFVRGNNVLDTKNVVFLNPGDVSSSPQAGIFDYQIFYTETGRAGGAYLGDDVNEDGIQDWVPLNDPRVFAEGRAIRLGVGVQF